MILIYKSAATALIAGIAGIAILKGCTAAEIIKPLNTQQDAIAAPLPLPTHGCHPNGCGYIDFEKHPELAGGAIVYEPTN